MKRSKQKKLAAAVLTAATVFLLLMGCATTIWFFASVQTSKFQKVQDKAQIVEVEDEVHLEIPVSKQPLLIDIHESTGEVISRRISFETAKQLVSSDKMLLEKVMPWEVLVTEEDLRASAKKNAKHSPFKEETFMAIFFQETDGGNNVGQPGRLHNTLSSDGYFTGKEYCRVRGIDPNEILLSKTGAGGLMQGQLSMIARHCGVEVKYGNTPTVLLHGTTEHRNMSARDRRAGIRTVQRKLGFSRRDADGLLSTETLRRIRRVTGERVETRQQFEEELVGRRAKYKLIDLYFADQVKVDFNNPENDLVFQRICLLEGKNWKRTKYFRFNLWNPMHAGAYIAVHMESDETSAKRYASQAGRRLSKKQLEDIVITAYYCGIKSSWLGNTRGPRTEKEKAGIKYRDEVNTIKRSLS